MPRRILLADDCSSVRQKVKGLLECEGFEVVGEAADGQEAVRLAQALCPDFAVLEFNMPKLNGLDAARQIILGSPQTRVILLTMHDEEAYVVQALRAGIRGYVLKTQVVDDLARAIEEVSRGEVYLSPCVPWAAIDSHPPKSSPWAIPEQPCSGRRER